MKHAVVITVTSKSVVSPDIEALRQTIEREGEPWRLRFVDKTPDHVFPNQILVSVVLEASSHAEARTRAYAAVDRAVGRSQGLPDAKVLVVLSMPDGHPTTQRQDLPDIGSEGQVLDFC